ncbi:ion transporter [Desulfonema ishimotonii]|uniref:Ion transporter n=1 Tax=Desulfonema ishimotonii TaxID=45657 RepID=A0A401FVF9_9BACT|nr:potassium channel family protein [Desulfonema ishimotonii]GBC60967.1 ion transporter [Desulfonema ishimotonii]
MNTDKIRLRIYLAIFTTLLSLGILGFMFFENFSFVDAIYFSIVTMATVGYGDLHPQSDIGKILALIMITGGVGTFLGVVARGSGDTLLGSGDWFGGHLGSGWFGGQVRGTVRGTGSQVRGVRDGSRFGGHLGSGDTLLNY